MFVFVSFCGAAASRAEIQNTLTTCRERNGHVMSSQTHIHQTHKYTQRCVTNAAPLAEAIWDGTPALNETSRMDSAHCMKHKHDNLSADS